MMIPRPLQIARLARNVDSAVIRFVEYLCAPRDSATSYVPEILFRRRTSYSTPIEIHTHGLRLLGKYSQKWMLDNRSDLVGVINLVEVDDEDEELGDISAITIARDGNFSFDRSLDMKWRFFSQDGFEALNDQTEMALCNEIAAAVQKRIAVYQF